MAFPNNDMPPLAEWIPPTVRRLGCTQVVVAAGINDMVRTDVVAPVGAACCRLVDALESAGVQVWLATVTPYRQDDAGWAQALNGRRLRWNDWLRAFMPDRLIDWESGLRSGQWMRTDLSLDGLHPNVAGQQVLASAFAATWHA